VAYPGATADLVFYTANEIHIPVGQPGLFDLQSPDVIHSFWVPPLGGKTDVIPGQTTHAWLLADHPGRYRGQCAEYCGAQHAHMALFVVAQSLEEFHAWQTRQRTPSPAVADKASPQGIGKTVFRLHCAACHTVGGTMAQGKTGPDLTHLMGRQSLAAGTLPNSPENLRAWITAPQRFKPGTLMPRIPLAESDMQALLAYLQTLE
jgi:cytochrome c oxidase subunit 2